MEGTVRQAGQRQRQGGLRMERKKYQEDGAQEAARALQQGGESTERWQQRAKTIEGTEKEPCLPYPSVAVQSKVCPQPAPAV